MLRAIAVRPTFRRRGHARALAEHLIRMAYDGGVGRVYTTAASPWFIEEIGFEFRERGVLLDDVSRLAGIIDALTRATKRLEARADALSLTDDELALAHAHREATSGRGAIQHAPDDELDGQVLLPTRRKARLDGFDLDAEVAVAAHDHERREGLLRYFRRPPLSHDRLRDLPSPRGGVVILQLKKPGRDRTTHIELTPHAFLTRLASLVPRPRKNTSLYFGVLAGNAKRRKNLVRKTERSAPRKEDASWVALMKHSFGLDVLGCPRPGCKRCLALVAVIVDRAEVKRLLVYLRLFTEPIPVQSARDPPDLWTEAYDFD